LKLRRPTSPVESTKAVCTDASRMKKIGMAADSRSAFRGSILMALSRRCFCTTHLNVLPMPNCWKHEYRTLSLVY